MSLDKNERLEMSSEDPVKGRRASQWLPTAGIALATPFLVWFAIGAPPTYSSYRFGPYDVGPESGYLVGGVAAIVAAAAVAVLVIRTRRGTVGRSWAVVVPLAIAGALGAAGWRVGTSTYSGADIGGPVVMLIDPLLIAGLLVGAVRIAGALGRWTLRRTRLLTVAAVLVAPALYAVMYGLSKYDASAGLITQRQYSDVRVGQTRLAVHEMLGRERHLDDSESVFFPAVPSGLLCDYYDEWDGPAFVHAYQFCFRQGVLVRKAIR